MSILNLARMFRPKSIALIGASARKGTVGAAILQNLIEGGFQGPIYPVNPRHREIGGRTAFPRITDISETVDMAVVATPIQTVPAIIADCAIAGVGGAVIISSGGKETGTRGREIERDIAAASKDSGVRIIGPNCLGVINNQENLNASFAARCHCRAAWPLFLKAVWSAERSWILR